ncbi:26S proteasome non-ATPase regulatory subunit [Musa troglodytarum]|uniref:26S proteasome non-ATPase regulatory subunit n=1 Tax=Musa troglodytarum TaxID=320322 RepID=A0A9E7HIJ5_9LILI|nr:26S proteasome non-ATPase regulatory subunit [Musa troglodytarum]
MQFVRVLCFSEKIVILWCEMGSDLKEIASLIETGAQAKEVRRIVRAVRLTMTLRRKLKASVISAFLGHVLAPGSEVLAKLSSYLPKTDEHEMDVDTAASAVQGPAKHSIPELEIYCYLLVLIFLIDQRDMMRTLLALHRMATLRRDELGQFCRYLFYLGKIRTIQLEYTDAKRASCKLLGKHQLLRVAFESSATTRKLRLDSENPVADAESIVAKAIRDGAVDAIIDHANGWMVSKETGNDCLLPQHAHEAVRALRFPPNSNKEKESREKRRERQQQEQELAKHIAEEDDDA